MSSHLLTSPQDVVRALLTYVDWWQPFTSSVLQATHRGGEHDGIRAGLVEHLEERAELCRRMERLDERERRLLYLWYVKDASPREISRACKVSLRHCHRVRAKAIRTIVELGDPQAA